MKNIIDIGIKLFGAKSAAQDVDGLKKKIIELEKANSRLGKEFNKVSQAHSKLREKKNDVVGLDTAFKNFNRTMFSLTAFIGLFTGAMRTLSGVLDQGAELDRLRSQFLRVFGQDSDITKSIEQFTDTYIDRMTAMKAAVSLKELGVFRSLDDVSKFIAKAGAAARLAGLNTAEGVTHAIKFMKDGAISHLEFLNLIRRTNPALAAELTILKAKGGILGGVVSQQQKLNIAMRLLDAATRNSMFGLRDNMDEWSNFKDELSNLGKAFGSLVLTGLGPFLKELTIVIRHTREWIESLDEANGVGAKTVGWVTALGVGLAGIGTALGSIALLAKSAKFLFGISLFGGGIGGALETGALKGLYFIDSFKAALLGLKGFFGGIGSWIATGLTTKLSASLGTLVSTTILVPLVGYLSHLFGKFLDKLFSFSDTLSSLFTSPGETNQQLMSTIRSPDASLLDKIKAGVNYGLGNTFGLPGQFAGEVMNQYYTPQVNVNPPMVDNIINDSRPIFEGKETEQTLNIIQEKEKNQMSDAFYSALISKDKNTSDTNTSYMEEMLDLMRSHLESIDRKTNDESFIDLMRKSKVK